MSDQEKKIKIVFLLPAIKAGGAERVIINLINNLPVHIFNVELIVLFDCEDGFQKLLHPSVTKQNQTHPTHRDLFLKPSRFYRVIKEKKPDILFSGYGELNPIVALYSLLFTECKFIARETSIPSLRIKKQVIYIAYILFYRFFSRIIVQSRAMQKDLIDKFYIAKRKTVLIKNLIDCVAIDTALGECVKNELNSDAKLFLFVGSLDSNKCVHRIVLFFEKICIVYPKSKLIIVGDGPEKAVIYERISRSLFSEQIEMKPSTKNPYLYMNSADFLLIASEYEGFPNVGIEAMYCGTPVLLDKRTAGGATELIQLGINGEIINFEDPDFSFLYRSYNKELMKEYVIQNHGVNTVIESYIRLFKEISEVPNF